MKFHQKVLNKLINKNLFGFLSDRQFLKLKYRVHMDKKLDLDNPKTYNEKLQWLKLNDRKPEYTTMVDKYAVREYIKDKIGEEYLIPLIGAWDSVEEIDFDSLPNEFVLKCNHDSGGLVICKDKTSLDIASAKKKLSKAMKRDFYKLSREWPYKNVKRKIIAEKFMVDESGTELKDYKFFCFDGKCEFMFIATDRPHDTKFDFYDMDFNHLPFTQGHPNATKEIQKPKAFDEMKELAQKLSKGIKQVRIDFYEINGKVYFGEITFFHYSGFTPFEPEEWDYKFGELINLK
ncbi:MAG: glycosyl transferase [Clostridia bacterium]|nr:glycosyl transferase [Clostridia bacterium]